MSDLWPVQNTVMAEDRFAMTPESVLRAVKGAESRNLDVLAAYHSHPNGQAVPSEIDREDAIPGMLHVIIGSAGCSELRAWRLSKQNVFETVTLTTSCP